MNAETPINDLARHRTWPILHSILQFDRSVLDVMREACLQGAVDMAVTLLSKKRLVDTLAEANRGTT